MVNYLHPPTHPDNNKKIGFQKGGLPMQKSKTQISFTRTMFQKIINWTPRECKHIPSGDKLSFTFAMVYTLTITKFKEKPKEELPTTKHLHSTIQITQNTTTWKKKIKDSNGQLSERFAYCFQDDTLKERTQTNKIHGARSCNSSLWITLTIPT